MTILIAKPYSFNFSSAESAIYHDKSDPGDGNTIWQGVDFRVVEPTQELWIEVKSWNFPGVQDATVKIRSTKDFSQKLDGTKTEEFRDDIVNKFLGTTSYLHWSGIGPPNNVTYIVLLMPPNRGSTPLLGPFQDRLRDRFKNARARGWDRRVNYFVMDLTLFTSAFPQYVVERL